MLIFRGGKCQTLTAHLKMHNKLQTYTLFEHLKMHHMPNLVMKCPGNILLQESKEKMKEFWNP